MANNVFKMPKVVKWLIIFLNFPKTQNYVTKKRYNYSVSDSNSDFSSNSMSDSYSDSESDSNSVFM